MTPPNTQYPFILVDASSYFFRAFHALPPLSNSKGQPTGAVYGVINMIRSLLKDYDPRYIAIVFDTKGKTFRDDLYPEYKANRPPMPDELSAQFAPLVEIIEAMGLSLLVIEGVEADDVIGTLARQAANQGINTLISTGDKDLAQLVNDKITLVNTMSDKITTPEAVIEKYGVTPKQFIDYLTLTGDKVDNVPGVENVGPKTAAKWLQAYNNLEKLIAHAEEIKGKIGENLRSSLENLELSKVLVTIKDDVDLDFQVTDLSKKPIEKKRLVELFKELEFRNWLDTLLKEHPNSKPSKKDYQVILNEKDLDQWIKRLEKADLFAFDTETTDLDYINAELVGISFSVQEGQAAYVPIAHDYLDAPTQISLPKVLERIKPLLENPKQKKLGQNLKYDMSVLARYDVHFENIAFDTMLESYVLNSLGTRHDMDSLALKYLGKRTIHFEDIAGKGAKQLTFNQIPLEEAGPYAAEDADITLQLHQVLWPKIEKEKGLKYVFEKIEMPLVSVLSRMERQGVLIDSELLYKQSKVFEKRMIEIQAKVFSLAGETFNLNSTKQLQTILFEKLKLPSLSKTPKGQPSTAEPVLQELALDYPLPKLILEYRSLSKLKSTYTDALPMQINPTTGRVHTSYNQAVAATGRLSSANPNLQNIPVRTEEGRRIRQAFIAPKGYKILAADYSQIELRIMAHLTDDPGLKKAFKAGFDIHRATASEVFGIPFEEVTLDQRRHAKAINFGLIYGMSSFGLAKQIGTSREAAQEYIELYFHRYPNVKNYMEETRQKAHEIGYVETLYGRRLYLPEINARNLQRQRAAERTAINAPLQGSAADIIKIAMINIDQWLQSSKIKARMIMQVHDELVFEVAENDVDILINEVENKMCKAVSLSVALEVDIGVGDNWEEAH